MGNKDKQELNNSKQVKDLNYLLDVFPKWFNVYKTIAERLNSKGIRTAYGKEYAYNNVYQCVKGRWYDPNIHEELATIRKEYIAKQNKIKNLESIEAR
ncbi:hypothetical protein DYBT9275_02706 [Dyadobacter sp. CECT 9275]|uniref:Uncharacterized protein n=1 Tax=Dyadobacter helix TaxID=2822344 RepID=A0A916NLL6_9BACT|nr:hypothetical protein DYBT9275_02706 [Dyadobacter sp. CECT 9275]